MSTGERHCQVAGRSTSNAGAGAAMDEINLIQWWIEWWIKSPNYTIPKHSKTDGS